MENCYTFSFLFFSLTAIFFLFTIIVLLLREQEKHNYIYDLTKKLDEFTSVPKLAYVLSDEIKKLLGAEFVCVVEYTYSKTDVLSSLPAKSVDKAFSYPHEIFYILKTLQQEKADYINEDDVKSEHLKQYFPLFNFKTYKIIPIYNDEFRIITLEIYGETKSLVHFKKHILSKIIELFQKAFLSRIILQNDILKVKMNETIIKFLDRIRNTLDENELEKIILEEITQSFGADRAFFIRSYAANPQVPRIGKEYLANPYAKSLIGNNLDYHSVWEQLKETQANPPVFVIENSEKFIKQNKLENSPIDIFIKNSQIKSSYPFLIYEDEMYSMYLVLQFTRKIVIFDKNDFEIMELLSKQSHIALVQAKLYSKLLLNSKEENLLIDLISTLRSSFSINKIANEFTAKVGLFFDAQRCVIRFFDNEKKEFKGYSEAFEYKKNYMVSGTKNMNLQKELGDFLINSEKFHDTVSIRYSVDLTGKDFEFKEDILRYFERYEIKTYLVAFVRYNGKLLGFLALHFCDDFEIKKHQEDLIKALADQLGIAVYQSELYFDIQNVAKKEKFLKEIYSDTLGLQNKEQIYKYFSEKLSILFGAIGIVFVEYITENNKKYYEYYQEKYNNIANFKEFAFFQNIIDKKNFIYYCNLHTEEKSAINDFIKNTNIQCFATIPIDTQKTLILFFDKKRAFSNFDKSIISALTETISQTVKDIIQKAEIQNLRETFLSTLTHDLQIPIIAQRNAMEYLRTKTTEQNKNEKFFEILNYLEETNAQTEDMIKVLSSIYRYEASKKELNKIEFNIIDALENAFSKFQKELEKNNIKVNRNYSEKEILILGDKIEIEKIFEIFFQCSAFENNNIDIEFLKQEYTIQCCFTSAKNIISENLEKIIFDRNLVAANLERKVGEGIHIYFAKLIAIAHGGKIYINENKGNLNSFCLELPL